MLAMTAVAAAEETKPNTTKCMALAMSGGGTLGAYEAGALWGMYYGLADKKEMEYDVVTGVSAGSINLGLVSVYPKGQEEAMVNDLSHRWESLKQDDLYVDWTLGKVRGVTDKSGLVNTQPLTDYLDKFFAEHNNTFHRKFVVAAVDVNTGSYMTFDETEKNPAKAITSSASIPFIFPSQKWDHGVAMDGGTVWNLNLISAIDRCKEIVDDESEITIDIVVCHEGEKINTWSDGGSTMNNWLRYDQIRSAKASNQDIYDVMHAFPKINYRYYVAPTGPLASGLDIIKVDNATVTGPAQDLGRKDGANVVKSGAGKLFQDFKDNFKSKYDAKMPKQGAKEGTVDLEFLQN